MLTILVKQPRGSFNYDFEISGYFWHEVRDSQFEFVTKNVTKLDYISWLLL